MIIKVHIQPNAKKNEIVGHHGDAIKIKLKAPPVNGKANETLMDFLSEAFNISKRELSIISGQTSRQKLVKIDAEVDLSLLV
jgi:uncharacterized protein (TIGR00251 family)